MQSSSSTPRCFLVVTSNEQAHYAKKGVDLCASLGAAAGLPSLVKHLECGDYALVWAQHQSEVVQGGGQCIVLIERKALGDFEASLKDDRYRVQAWCLANSKVPRAFWIVTPGQLFNPDSIGAIRKAMARLTTSYDNIKVLQLESAELGAFASALKNIADCAHNTYFEENSRVEIPSLHKVQSDGERPKLVTQSTVYIEQLCVVQGMSKTKARAVVNRAPTMMSLLKMWRDARNVALQSVAPPPPKSRKRQLTVEEQVDAVLENVEVGKGKRLGPALSKRLRETIVPDLRQLEF